MYDFLVLTYTSVYLWLTSVNRWPHIHFSLIIDQIIVYCMGIDSFIYSIDKSHDGGIP